MFVRFALINLPGVPVIMASVWLNANSSIVPTRLRRPTSVGYNRS